MNKGKRLLGMTSRPKRRASRVSENYDDNQLWEDGAVYAGERLRIHATEWQDPVVLDHWGIGEDFNAFAAAAGLLGPHQEPLSPAWEGRPYPMGRPPGHPSGSLPHLFNKKSS